MRCENIKNVPILLKKSIKSMENYAFFVNSKLFFVSFFDDFLIKNAISISKKYGSRYLKNNNKRIYIFYTSTIILIKKRYHTTPPHQINKKQYQYISFIYIFQFSSVFLYHLYEYLIPPYTNKGVAVND